MAVIYIREDTALPQRIDKDHYPTPYPVVEAVMARFARPDAVSILDIGAGDDGRWGVAAVGHCRSPLCLVGVDIRPLPKPDLYTFWHTMDYTLPIERAQMSVKHFDLIVSNPPFVVAEEIVWGAWGQLNPGGAMVFLLPFAFWFGQKRHRWLWREIPPVEVCAIVGRIPFTGSGNPDNHAIYVWEKDEAGRPVGMANETRLTQMEV